jgi:hypothetical protein
MLHKHLFSRGDVPQLYDIQKIEKSHYGLTIPKVVYDSFASECNEEVLKTHFEIGRLIRKTVKNGNVILKFNLRIGRASIGVALAHVFDWLNDKDLCKQLPEDGPKQLCSFTFARKSFAVSFAPWTHQYLKDISISKSFFKLAEEEMRTFYIDALGKGSAHSYIECRHNERAVHFTLFGNGLWLSGNYDGDISTHNCETSIDQFTFFVGIVAVCDALKRYLKTVSVDPN